MTERPGLPSRKRIFCNKCRTETNHTVECDRARRDYLEEDGQIVFWEEHVYRLWICAGCENATLEECLTIQGAEREDGTPIYDSTYFPKRIEYDVAGMRFIQLPQKLDKIYRELIKAFNNQLYLLCAAGLRALIEGICENKQIHGRTLEEKINALDKIIPPNIAANLHSFRFMGNEALHKITAPHLEDLRLAIEISEDLLNFLYELDYKARRLSVKRRKRAKAGGG